MTTASSSPCISLNSAEVRSALSAMMPELRAHWSRPLRDWAEFVYTLPAVPSRHPVRIDACRRLSQLVECVALRTGYSADDAAAARLQIERVPVLQTGPHCHLLVEPDAFYTHHFSLIGLQAHDLNWHFWYGTSTVKFLESAGKGPGWLKINDHPVNVFGLPRRRMDAFSVCGISTERFRFELRCNGHQEDAVRTLSRWLPDAEFPSAAEAIKTANIALWARSMSKETKLLQLDDFDIADLVAGHLEDPSSWLSRHLCGDNCFGKALLDFTRLLDAEPWGGWVRTTTDLFWGLSDGRLFPLRLHEDGLEGKGKRYPPICFEPESLARALRAREIVPSLILTFLVLSILPGTRVLGGCRQVVYYPLMRRIVCAALARCGAGDVGDDIESDVQLGVWGHRVLKPRFLEPINEMQSSDASARLDMFGSRHLEDACGDLSSFTRDPLWAGLCGRIDPASPSIDLPDFRGLERW